VKVTTNFQSESSNVDLVVYNVDRGSRHKVETVGFRQRACRRRVTLFARSWLSHTGSCSLEESLATNCSTKACRVSRLITRIVAVHCGGGHCAEQRCSLKSTFGHRLVSEWGGILSVIAILRQQSQSLWICRPSNRSGESETVGDYCGRTFVALMYWLPKLSNSYCPFFLSKRILAAAMI